MNPVELLIYAAAREFRSAPRRFLDADWRARRASNHATNPFGWLA